MTFAPAPDAPAVVAAAGPAAAVREGRDLRRILLLDGLLAVAVASMSLPTVLLYLPGDIVGVGADGVAIEGITPLSQGWSIVYAVACTAPLALRRIWPRTVHAAVLALTLVPLVAHSVVTLDTTPVLVSLFSVASLLRGWRFPAVAAVASVAVLIGPSFLTWPSGEDISGLHWWDFLVSFPYAVLPVALAVVAGQALQRERIRAEAHQRATVAAVVASEARAEAAVSAERRRLAAELHDIVAHHVSLMVVQAEAGPYAAGNATAAGSAASTFGAIADRGRTALGELDRLLGVLRRDGDGMAGAVPLAPLPTLHEVPGLVGSARQAGVPIELVRFDPPPVIDGALSATGHRIAQECVTNVIKHGDHRRPATLAVSHDGAMLRITCENRVGPAAPADADRDGHGLLSIRSRVEVFGGSLRAGEADGWFRVEAVLPLQADDRAIGATA